METSKKKDNRGGSRKGAGRKPSPIQRVYLTIRITERAKHQAEQVAKEKGITVSKLIEEIFEHEGSD